MEIMFILERKKTFHFSYNNIMPYAEAVYFRSMFEQNTVSMALLENPTARGTRENVSPGATRSDNSGTLK